MDMDEFYQSTACHVCKKIMPMLKRCSRCKLYAYCSKEHQKLHWNYHKEFCKMVNSLLTKDGKNRQHIFDIPNTSNLSHKEWNQMKIDLKYLWQHLLGRKLTKGEDQLWMFPRICETCRNSKQDILIDCPICFSVSYCCVEHQTAHFNIHKNYCHSLKLCYEINTHLFNNKTFLQPLPKICSNYKTKTFVDCITDESDFAKILIADIISPFLTTIFALETCNLLENQQFTKNSLVIHFVGASVYEMSLPLCDICEYFFHYITNLTQITLILIGPEVNELCSKNEQCSDKSYSILFERCLYHDYASSHSSIPADLIVAFNCGLHEFEQESGKDSWAKSVRDMTRGDVSLLVTAYTLDEARKDLQRLLDTDNPLQVVVSCRENQYRGRRPLRDWTTQDAPIFYQNNYVTVVKPISNK